MRWRCGTGIRGCGARSGPGRRRCGWPARSPGGASARGLDAAQAEWVDAETTPYITTLPPKRFLDLVEAKIIEADPEAAEERARAKALARFVHAGRVDEHGLRTLVARAHAGDVTYLVAVLDRIAVILAQRGDDRPLDVLRAEALRVLGNPARALALLPRRPWRPPTRRSRRRASSGGTALFPHGDTGVDLRRRRPAAAGRSIPTSTTCRCWTTDELAALPEFQALAGAVAGASAVGGERARPASRSTPTPAC